MRNDISCMLPLPIADRIFLFFGSSHSCVEELCCGVLETPKCSLSKTKYTAFGNYLSVLLDGGGLSFIDIPIGRHPFFADIWVGCRLCFAGYGYAVL